MFQDFEDHLKYDEDRSPHTVRGYLSDLRQFAHWFEQTNAEPLSPRTITRTDLREYRQFMLTIKNLSANTINRRLAALSVYLGWAKDQGVIDNNPADKVTGVSRQKAAPKWLERTEDSALIRQAEKDLQAAQTDPARKRARRDLSIVIFMLNTGLRSSEVCSLQLGDLEIKERSGQVEVLG